MKNLIVLSILFTFLFIACEPCIDDPDPKPELPVSIIELIPTITPIIADHSHVEFYNRSTGTIDESYWDFGQKEAKYNLPGSENPYYVFDFEGRKEITLTVTGPEGSDLSSTFVDVHAMNPSCNKYYNSNGNSSSCYSSGAIQLVRENNMLDIGRIKIFNPYNDKVSVHLYHPDSWLNGKYQNFASWDINSLNNVFLAYDGSTLFMGNDWGIRVEFPNGVESCVWSIHSLGYQINNGIYYVNLAKVYEGAGF